MSDTRKLLLVLAALLAVLLAPVLYIVRAQSKLPVATLAATQLTVDVPHSSWLARCTALPITAIEGLTVLKATVYADRVTAVLVKDKAVGFARCHKLGVYDKIPAYACWGPTALRDKMAADKVGCVAGGVIDWGKVAVADPKLVAWIAERSTCCGVATVGGEVRSEWPCRWELEPGRVTVTSRSGYGPGVVGAEQPCSHVAP